MAEQLPIIIVLAPLFGSLIVCLIGARNHGACLAISVVSLVTALAAAVGTCWQVYSTGPIDYFVGGWDANKVVDGVEVP